MNRQLPSSIFTGLYIALGITLLHFVWNRTVENSEPVAFYNYLIFFLICFAGLVVSLEWSVFRRLKSLRVISQREIKKLRELEAYRREFLAEVSHELKTPIFAIQGFIHTLQDGAVEDLRVRDKFLKKAGKNADRLSNLVQDILVITQAESGEIHMKIRPFVMHELIQDVIDAVQYKFTKKKRNISYSVEAHGMEAVEVLADRERIQQVLINLVDNAIKYGDPEGTITIRLEADDEQPKMIVSVSDDGPGIEEEHLGKIFRRFYRVDKSRSRDKGGTGLGLAICKHFLTAHGEQIHVDSRLGAGTTFRFTLKLA